jgi:Micrococcal nuclease (thermonuclease) homologs
MATPFACVRRGKALTVRLACIDAPESAQPPYGQQARTYLQQHLPIDREVSLNIKTTDRYGRSVAEISARPSLIWPWWKPVWHSRIGST